MAPGGVGRYTFQFANRGPSNAPDVVVRDTLPDGLTFVGDTAGACDAVGQALTCALGPLDAGGSGELGVDVEVDPALAGETMRNAASIAAEPGDPSLVPAEVVASSNLDAADLVVGPLRLRSRSSDTVPTMPAPTTPPDDARADDAPPPAASRASSSRSRSAVPARASATSWCGRSGSATPATGRRAAWS